jgi:hypothetical protein
LIHYINCEGVFRFDENQNAYIQQTAQTPAQSGDIIFGMFKVTSANDLVPDTGTQLTGVFAQQVSAINANIVTLNPVSSLNVTLKDFAGPSQSAFTLSEYMTPSNGINPIFSFYQTPYVSTFDDPTKTMRQMLDAVTDGNLYATFGYIPDSGNGFDIADTANAPRISSYGGLNILQNNTGLDFIKITASDSEFTNNYPFTIQAMVGPLMPVDLLLISAITPNDVVGSRWAIKSSDPALLQTVVPTPAAFWGGLGLLGGMGLLRLRRKQA